MSFRDAVPQSAKKRAAESSKTLFAAFMKGITLFDSNANAETCFVERWVYDRLYENEMRESTASEDALPGTQLRLRMAYEGRLPVQLTIERPTEIEMYVHNGFWRTDAMGTVWKYDDLVLCSKVVGAQRFFKVQTPLGEEPWVVDDRNPPVDLRATQRERDDRNPHEDDALDI